tara:strand:+ start:2346 stop:2525 length:180 start_codon:yes stop_codon:yes gene_type:complete
MREGREREHWDRLSFDMYQRAALKGVKDIDANTYHKFEAHNSNKSLNKETIHNLKGVFA